jgi:hypothetical protein
MHEEAPASPPKNGAGEAGKVTEGRAFEPGPVAEGCALEAGTVTEGRPVEVGPVAEGCAGLVVDAIFRVI